MNRLFSIIIPTLNEASTIEQTLQALQPLRDREHEIIVVDGGSIDNTQALAAPLADQVLSAPRGRAAQMNTGAAVATGQVLLFLHADTVLPAHADVMVLMGIVTHRRGWGRFDVRLSGEPVLLRVVERMMNLRSRLTGIATGDQAIFMTRQFYDAVNGFPNISLMEDITISGHLKRLSRPVCLRQRVVTSSRRWEENGIIRTILLMWWLRFAYFVGVHPDTLKKQYG